MSAHRRALLFGHSSSDPERKPSRQRVQGLIQRFGRLLSEESRYDFGNLTDGSGSPDSIINPTRAEIVELAGRALQVTNETLLLLYYVGHSTDFGLADVSLYLSTADGARDQTMSASELISEFRRNGFSKIVLILDSCHTGRLEQSFAADANIYCMLGSGYGFAFNADFSEKIFSTLDRQLARRDPRIDRRLGGMTYRKIFESTLAHFQDSQLGEMGYSQKPSQSGLLGDTVIIPAPEIVPDEYNHFADRRTVYGRLFTVLELAAVNVAGIDDFIRTVRDHRAFLLRQDEGAGVRVGAGRVQNYIDFLISCRLVTAERGVVRLTERGVSAADYEFYNREILSAVQEFILPDLTMGELNVVCKELIDNMQPPTAARVVRHLRSKGRDCELTDELRLAFSVLPSTGKFSRGSADALYPPE